MSAGAVIVIRRCRIQRLNRLRTKCLPATSSHCHLEGDAPMNSPNAKLAVVTGASTGIGLELARLCARDGFDLIVAADEPRVADAARELAETGVACTPVQCDLATAEGVRQLLDVIGGRAVDALCANAGRGLGK